MAVSSGSWVISLVKKLFGVYVKYGWHGLLGRFSSSPQDFLTGWCSCVLRLRTSVERVASPDVSSLQFGAAFLSLTVLASAAILVFLVIQRQQAGASIANVGTAARLGPGCWRGGGGRLQACGLDKLEPQYFSPQPLAVILFFVFCCSEHHLSCYLC